MEVMRQFLKILFKFQIMKDLFEEQILNLQSTDVKDLIKRKVKIYLTRRDLDKQQYIGVIQEVNLSNNSPYKPFDMKIKLENGKEISLGINGIEKVEFLK